MQPGGSTLPAASTLLEIPVRQAGGLAPKTWACQYKGHLAIGFWKCLLQIGANRVQIANSLLRSDARLQTSNHHVHRNGPALVQLIRLWPCSLSIGIKKSG